MAWIAVEELSRAGLLEEKIKRPAVAGAEPEGGDKEDSGGGSDRCACGDEHSRAHGQPCG